MSSKNDNDNSGAAFLMAGFVVVALFLAALLAFASLIFTILCIIAWNRPLTIFRQTLEPEEARTFVMCGLVFAVLVPAFIAFVDLVSDVRINWDYWPYFVGVGYVIGSIGIGILMAEDSPSASTAIDITPPQIPTARPKALPRPDAPPFRYASWDDEEERGR
jgi:hypothetical protein